MSFVEVEDVQLLQVGEFVKLEGSWFRHPFPTNSFTIKSSEDLAIIQGLTNIRILYDPERTASVECEENRQDSSSFSAALSESLDSHYPESVASGEQNHKEEETLISESALSEVLARRERYRGYVDSLRKVERAYQNTLYQGHELFRQLTGRRPAGLKTSDAIITNILQNVDHPQSYLSRMGQSGSEESAWGLTEHAVNVCILSLLVGRQLSLDEDMLVELGRGALFHDIGYRALPMNVKFYPGGMKVEANPELRILHAELGSQLVDSFLNAGPMLLEIIAHHHERLDGSGFPNGLGKGELSLLTRIVMVADHFDELCNTPNSDANLNPHAALSRLYRHVVMKGESSKYCAQVVQALVQAIGVYPPGSFVELTDGFIGVVSSINLHHPNKPIVLLYAPWLGPYGGLLANLARDPTIEIKHAVPAKDLEAKALAYLNSHRMALSIHVMESTSVAVNRRIPRSLKPALQH